MSTITDEMVKAALEAFNSIKGSNNGAAKMRAALAASERARPHEPFMAVAPDAVTPRSARFNHDCLNPDVTIRRSRHETR